MTNFNTNLIKLGTVRIKDNAQRPITFPDLSPIISKVLSTGKTADGEPFESGILSDSWMYAPNRSRLVANEQPDVQVSFRDDSFSQQRSDSEDRWRLREERYNYNRDDRDYDARDREYDGHRQILSRYDRRDSTRHSRREDPAELIGIVMRKQESHSDGEQPELFIDIDIYGTEENSVSTYTKAMERFLGRTKTLQALLSDSTAICFQGQLYYTVSNRQDEIVLSVLGLNKGTPHESMEFPYLALSTERVQIKENPFIPLDRFIESQQNVLDILKEKLPK